ncbi:hypothetical protein [Anabaena sp. PCC 7108]|nr:hypothetical protein [Anabaena sp. PCC 7108]
MKIKSGNQFVRNHRTNESIDAETLGLAYGFLGVLTAGSDMLTDKTCRLP